MQADHVKYAS
jgi:hypothetical protein